MPCLFLTNLPEGVTYAPAAVKAIHDKVLELTGHELSVHLSNETLTILHPDGSRTPAPDVHGTVVMSQRPWAISKAIMEAMVAFMHTFGWYKHDLTLVEVPDGGFWVDGKMIGPEPVVKPD